MKAISPVRGNPIVHPGFTVCIPELINIPLYAVSSHCPHTTFYEVSPSINQPLQSLGALFAPKWMKTAMLKESRNRSRFN
jgi:hypothetical protein